MTKDEIFGKCDWEGGVAECIIGYGLNEANLPEDAPAEVVRAWKRLREEASKDVETIQDWLDS
jgi:hypothetical protein